MSKGTEQELTWEAQGASSPLRAEKYTGTETGLGCRKSFYFLGNGRKSTGDFK